MAEQAASIALLSPALAPGSVLARKYRIERVLGEGGMGVVIAARHLELGHRVAVKVLAPAAALRSTAIDRFLREGRAAARLTSPHAARVYDVGRLPEGVPFLVMELVSGRDLATILHNEGPQPWERVVRWCREAANALVEAHACGVIHRDIKPGNLMLADVVGGRPIVKVLDFGISKLVEDASLTRSAVVMGSPQYMAPEQLISSEHVSPMIDIWALGVVLFELSTGRVPFEGRTMAELVAGIQSAMPPPPSLLVKGIPSSFDAVVLRCLAKRPDARFESMAALVEVLTELEASARPDAVASRVVRSSELPRIGAPHFGDETVSAARVSPARAGESIRHPARGSRRLLWIGIGFVLAPAIVLAALSYAVRPQQAGGHVPVADAPSPVVTVASPYILPDPPALAPASGSEAAPEPPPVVTEPSVRAQPPARPARPVTTAGRKPRLPTPAASGDSPSKPSMD